MEFLKQELAGLDIDTCLGEIQHDLQYNGKSIKARLLYIRYNDQCIDTDSFLTLIKDHVIVNFVITFEEIQKHYQRKNEVIAASDLYRKAIRKITKHTAQGKLGELILYLCIEKFFKAPKILSKISNLTDNQDQVKGADAVHAQYLNNQLVLFLGESKIWKQYGGACSDAVKSIKNSLDNYEEEFDLIESNIDFPNKNDALEREILTILNPYENLEMSFTMHVPCLIGFDSSICKNISSEKQYLQKYLGSAQKKIHTFYSKAVAHLPINEVTLLLLPFQSVNDFTKRFIEVLGIEK